EQKMVNACQDVLDAEHSVSTRDPHRACRCRDHKRRRRRREPRYLRGTVEMLQTHEDIDRGRTKAHDANRAATESARALYCPAFGVGTVSHRTAWLGDVCAARGQLHVKSKAQVSLARHLPQRVISFRPALAQFEIRGTHFVCEHARRKRDEQDQDQDEELAFHITCCWRPFLSVVRGFLSLPCNA